MDTVLNTNSALLQINFPTQVLKKISDFQVSEGRGEEGRRGPLSHPVIMFSWINSTSSNNLSPKAPTTGNKLQVCF